MALAGWNPDNRLLLTIDSSKIDEDLTDFPVLVALSSGTGVTSYDVTAVFDELTPASGTVSSGTVLLIHADGPNGSTAFTDSSPNNHTITAAADAKISTAQSVFGGSGAYFDGTGDYLSIADHDDWDFGNGNFAIDFWVYFSALTDWALLIDQTAGESAVDKAWEIGLTSAPYKINARFINGSSYYGSVTSQTVTTGQWYHVAFVRDGPNTYLFMDGIKVDTATDAGSLSINTPAIDVRIAKNGGWSYSGTLNGYMDELRISKGTVRWTSDFIPPTGPYGSSWDNRKKIAITTDVASPGIYDPWTKLMLHMDDTGLSDSSSSSHPVTKNGNADRSTAQSKFGGYSCYFDGSGDYLTIADHDDWDFGAGSFTIDFWIRFASSSWQWLLMQGPSGYWGFAFDNGNSKINAYNMANTTLDTGNSSVSLDTWHHVAITDDGATTRLFLDGELKDSDSSITITNETGSLYIGTNSTSVGTQSFNGYMDEVRISKGIARWTTTFTGTLPAAAYETSTTDTQLPVEIERWDSLNEKAWLWTKIPTISSGTDTTLFVYYDSTQDDSDYIGDTGDFIAQEIWDDDFAGVWHMTQDPSTNNMLDSTSNSNDGTPNGSMTSADLVDGKIGKSIEFDGSDDRITPTNDYGAASTDVLFMESTINTNLASTSQRIVARYQGVAPSGYYGWAFGVASSNYIFLSSDESQIATTSLSSDSTISTDTQYYVVGSKESGNSAAMKLFVNGVAQAATGNSETGTTHTNNVTIGYDDYNNLYPFSGEIDEVRFSNVTRSDAWVKATYYSNFDTLITFGSPFFVNFYFSNPIPVHLSTVYGTSQALRLITTVSGNTAPSYTYDASFYNATNDSQIGSTISGVNSGQYASTVLPTISGTDYNWYVIATSSGYNDTSSTYTFTNKFLCEGYTEINGARTVGIPVRLYRRSDGSLIGSDTSAGVSGTFAIPTDYNEYHYAVGLYTATISGEDATQTNSLIYDWITP